jgi:hypothetical protein
MDKPMNEQYVIIPSCYATHHEAFMKGKPAPVVYPWGVNLFSYKKPA